jgi:electron transport complex protein RnfC
MALAERGLWERAEFEGITDCMECGSCSYVCPANRPILDYIRLGKSTVNKLIRERNANKIN